MFIDLILALILVWSIVDGIRKGFVKQICSILAFLAGVWGASHYSDQVARKAFAWSKSMPLLEAYSSTRELSSLRPGRKVIRR